MMQFQQQKNFYRTKGDKQTPKMNYVTRIKVSSCPTIYSYLDGFMLFKDHYCEVSTNCTSQSLNNILQFYKFQKWFHLRLSLIPNRCTKCRSSLREHINAKQRKPDSIEICISLTCTLHQWSQYMMLLSASSILNDIPCQVVQYFVLLFIHTYTH